MAAFLTGLSLAFLTGALQVFLVALQGRQIAERARLWQVVLVGALISTVWVFNVRAAASGFWEAACYVAGAACGTALAMLVPLGKREDRK